MYCGGCGTENKKDSVFCENCGNKLEQQSVEPNKPSKSFMTRIKEIPTKTKIIVGSICGALVVIVALMIILGSLTNPKKIATKFFKVVANNDVEALYDYVEVKDSEFTSKKIFVKLYNNEEDEDKVELVNYKIGDAVISSDGMSASVNVTFLEKGEDTSEIYTIKLVKDKKKKWLFFDNWKINDSIASVSENSEIKVMKGSKVKIEGVEVSSKYLTKDSNSSFDIYSIPVMFKEYYEATIELPVGITIEDEIYPSSYGYTYDISLSDLDEKTTKKITDTIKANLQVIYDGVREKKSFDALKSSFEYKGADLSKLKTAYENLVDYMDSSVTLTSITFNNISINNLDIDSDGNLDISAKITYDYSLSYQSGDEVKTHDSNDYDSVYFTYTYVDNQFKLVDISSLTSYFSKYY